MGRFFKDSNFGKVTCTRLVLCTSPGLIGLADSRSCEYSYELENTLAN